jgi:DNA-binding CsgD family transcriptional regulator
MTNGHGRSPALLGRHSECKALDRLLVAVRAGQSQVLVLRGDAGVGKSALLEYLLDGASGCRIARAVGVESEMELAFAGVHQLCAPFLDRLRLLPAPQRDALGTAFGLGAGPASDRFLVGLAVLGLLSEVAEDRPLVCVVDDAQWQDRASAQTLAFVARRILAESVGLVFAVRDSPEQQEVAGLPELVVGGLSDHDSRALLRSAMPGRLDERVRDRIVAETHGNPLALLELPRGLTPAQLAGGFGLPDVMPLSNRIELNFVRRLELLPVETRRLLLTSAAEPVGDVSLLWRAAARLGLKADAAAPAESAGLIEPGVGVRFRHTLVRSAAYRAATPTDRQEVHQALAAATDPDTDPDRRAWHRAHAAPQPDEEVASELERSAGRAQARGGVAAAAAFLARATELTPEPARRGARALAAAQATLDAGAPEAAAGLLTTAETCSLDELQRARLQRLRGQIAFARRRGSDAPPLLLEAARLFEPLDSTLARETYLEAIGAAVFAGRLGSGAVAAAAAVARAAPPAAQPPRASDLLLDGLVTLFTDGYAPAVPLLQRALSASREDDDLRWLSLTCRVAPELWDDQAYHELTARHVRLARDAGALSALPIAATYRASMHVHAGEFTAASALTEESDAITRATGSAPLVYTALVLAGWRGNETMVSELIEASAQDANARGEGRAIALTGYTTAVLYNGLGRYEEALSVARRACEYEDLGLLGWSLIELVEAAARGGEPEIAADALGRLVERTGPSGTNRARGVEARSRALLAEDETAESHYRRGIECLGRTRIRGHLARGHLLYGEWLRRQSRRRHAREQLRTAHDMLTAIGADAFAERARRELLATGETVRKHSVETLDALTAQEAQIARLAADGHTNPEIGGQLFLSPRTVEYHLTKVFTKLGISSRRGLRSALPSVEQALAPT